MCSAVFSCEQSTNRAVSCYLGNRAMQMAAYRVSLCPRGSGLFRLGLGRPRADCAPLPGLLSPCPRDGARTLFSETGVWDRDYKADTRSRVEQWWHPRIMEQWRRDTLEEVSWQQFLSSLFAFCWPLVEASGKDCQMNILKHPWL